MSISLYEGVVQDEAHHRWTKSPRLNWATQFVTAYDGACFPNVSVRMARISFGALPRRKKKLDDSWRLDVVEIARVA